MINKIGKAVMALIGVIVAFYLVVLLTAWLAPLIVIALIVSAIAGIITIFVKKRTR